MMAHGKHFIRPIIALLVGAALFGLMLFFPALAQAQPERWQKEWPHTDFTQSAVDFSDIISGGPPKDGIPAIDKPDFSPVDEVDYLAPQEPVILLEHDGEAKAYPLQVMMWHEIVNDVIGSTPVTVTYCPLCNSAIIFDRRLNGRTLDFGVSGKLRHSDMIMYDRQTESWWQQFTGEAIVGEMTGQNLKIMTSRVMPYRVFAQTFPHGVVLLPPAETSRRYGQNPYAGYDKASRPFLYRGDYDGPVPALAYVIAVDDQAWPLADLRDAGTIIANDIRLTWHEGMSSALDNRNIARGRDIGYVTVEEKTGPGQYDDRPFDMTFAFAFKAFRPAGVIHTDVSRE